MFFYDPVVLEGHTDRILSLSVTPDGLYAISGGADKIVRMWDVNTGRCLRALSGHTDYVTGVGCTPDGRRAVSGSSDTTLRIWNLETGASDPPVQTHAQSVIIAGTTNAGQAVSGSVDRSAMVWDWETAEFVYETKYDDDFVTNVSFTPDGRKAVNVRDNAKPRIWDKKVGSPEWVAQEPDPTLTVWDLETNERLRILEGHTDNVLGVHVLQDGHRALSGSDDRTVRLWDIETGQCLRTFLGHTNSVRAVAATPDGMRAVSGSDDRTLRVWDLATGACVAVVCGPAPFRSVAIHPSRSRLIAGTSTGEVMFFDVRERDA
jgi:WD40 repeat protein